MNGLREQADRLRELVLSGGEILQAERERSRRIDFKSAVDMVTDLDRRVEAHLLAGLAAAFPDDAVRAEEGSAAEGGSGRTWHVDPLDGTTNYVHRHPFYAVSLGCVGPHGHELGAVYAPELDELYLAWRGGGATLERPRRGERRRLEPRGRVALTCALLGTGFPYERGVAAARNCDLVKTFLLARCHGVRRGGSAAIDLCHVASGRLDGYWELLLKPWDVAAGVLIAREAGARVTDLAGNEGTLDGRHVLAASPGLYDEMLASIRVEIPDLIGDG